MGFFFFLFWKKKYFKILISWPVVFTWHQCGTGKTVDFFLPYILLRKYFRISNESISMITQLELPEGESDTLSRNLSCRSVLHFDMQIIYIYLEKRMLSVSRVAFFWTYVDLPWVNMKCERNPSKHTFFTFYWWSSSGDAAFWYVRFKISRKIALKQNFLDNTFLYNSPLDFTVISHKIFKILTS